MTNQVIEEKTPLTLSTKILSFPGWKTALFMAAGIILGVGSLVTLSLLARPLALLFVAICIAAALNPLVKRLSVRVPRNTAILIIYGVLLLFFVVILAFLLTPLIAQIREFSQQLPDIVERGRELLDEVGISSEQLNSVTPQLGAAGQRLVATPFMLFSSILEIILVLIVSLYLLLDAPNLQNFILSLFAGKSREQVASVGTDMISKAGGYVRGVSIDVVIVSVITTIGLTIIGLPFPLILGITAGLFEVFPTVGSIIAAVPILIVAAFQSPTTFLITAGFVLFVQQLQGNVISPNVMKNQVDVPQFIVPIAILAGGAVGGVLGALIAVPLVAVLRVILLRVIAPLIRQYTGAEEPDDSESK